MNRSAFSGLLYNRCIEKTERNRGMDDKIRALAERMISGDEAAFDEIYHSYSGKLYRMAYFITGNRSDSEDILQDSFVKCFLHRNELKSPERFEFWMYQILVRTALKSERKKKGKKELSYDGMLESEETAGLAERIWMDKGDGPLEQIVKDETAREIRTAVERLDSKHRTVVLLYYYNGLGTKEIARMTGTLEGTVKSRLYKARADLRKSLEAANKEHPDRERRLCHE